MARTRAARGRVIRRMAAHGASVVRDPWVLLVSGLGAGAGWAVQLPVGAFLGIGAGMVVAAGVAKGFTTEGAAYVGASTVPPLRPGSEAAELVGRLRRAADRLGDMVPRFAGTTLGSPVVEAATGATAAVEQARRLAAAVDAIDDALAGMSELPAGPAGPAGQRRPESAQARQARTERAAAVQRLHTRRDELLGRIEAAYLRAEEVRARLLEVSATMASPGEDPDASSGLAEVSENLERLRHGLEELEATADHLRPNNRSL